MSKAGATAPIFTGGGGTMNVGERVRAARMEKGWGPGDLAEASGVSRTAIHAIESGRVARPRARTARWIATALAVSVSDLLGDVGGPDYIPIGGPVSVGPGGRVVVRIAEGREPVVSVVSPLEPAQDPHDLDRVPGPAAAGGVALGVEPPGDRPQR